MVVYKRMGMDSYYHVMCSGPFNRLLVKSGGAFW